MNFLRAEVNDDALVLRTCVRLFAVGDYFGVEQLTASARKMLGEHLTKVARDFQRSRTLNLANGRAFDHDQLPQAFSRAYIEQARYVFNLPSTAWSCIRESFLVLFQDTRFSVFRDGAFLKQVADIPELMTAVLKEMLTWQERYRQSILRLQCRKCHVKFVEDDDGKRRPWRNWSAGAAGLEFLSATCNKCSASP